MDGTIRISQRSGLTFLGHGARFKAFVRGPITSRGFSERRHFWILDSTRITMADMRVEGTNTQSDTGAAGYGTYNTKYEFEHAFALDSSSNVVLRNLSADAIWGDGLYLGGTKRNRNVVASGFSVDRNGRMGIALTNADGVTIDGAEIRHSRMAGFDFEPNPGNAVRNVEVRNSYTNSRLLAFASPGVSDVSNIYIHHNTVNETGVPWIFVKASDGSRRHDWRVYDNKVQKVLGSPMPGMLFTRVDNVDVQRNVSRVNASRDMDALKFESAQGLLQVIGNDFTGACEPYNKDSATSEVVATGNIVSAC